MCSVTCWTDGWWSISTTSWYTRIPWKNTSNMSELFYVYISSSINFTQRQRNVSSIRQKCHSWGISQEGVAMDDKKVRAVLNWPRPQSLKELQCFLGLANFYRCFIRNIVAAPLTSMTRQNSTSFAWTPETCQAFQELKHRFTTAPILTLVLMLAIALMML